MTDTPPGAIIRNRGRLWRVDGLQGEVLTATCLDGAQAEQVRCCLPLKKTCPPHHTATNHTDSLHRPDHQ